MRAAWRALAERRGWTHTSGGLLLGDVLDGPAGEIQIEARTALRSVGDSVRACTRITARPRQGTRRIPPYLDLEREGFGATLALAFGRYDFSIGDRPFDDEVHVRGDEVTALAALGADERDRYLDLAQQGVAVVRGGAVTLEVKGLVEEAERLEQLVDRCARLASGLAFVEEEIPGRLASQVEDPRSPHGVRARSFALLNARFPGTPEEQRAARSLLRDPDSTLRIAGARALGRDDDAALVLQRIAEENDGEEAGRAVEALACAAPRDRVAAVVQRILAADWVSPRIVASARVAEQLRLVEARDELLRLARTADETAAAASVRALTAIGGEGVESELIRLVGEGAPLPRAESVRGLERIGTVAAVEPLLLLRSVDGALLRAARAAVQRIQARLGDAEAGRLSVSETTEPSGRLSLPAGTDGALTLPDDAPPIAPEVSACDADPERPQRGRTQ